MSDSENQPMDNDMELEEQFIIRFPPDIAAEVLKSIEAGTIHEKLSIQLDSEFRNGVVRLNDQVLHAKLVELPTVVESYKTADNVHLYKTADIHEMLVCSTEPVKDEQQEEKLLGKELEKQLEAELEDKENKENDKNEENKENKEQVAKADIKDAPKVDEKILWPHGLTPPTKNLRRRRIANAMKAKTVENSEQDALKEVKYLLHMDSEAVRVEYEVVDDDGQPDEPDGAEEADDADEPGEPDQADEPGESDQADEPDQADESDPADKADKIDEPEEPDEPRESSSDGSESAVQDTDESDESSSDDSESDDENFDEIVNKLFL